MIVYILIFVDHGIIICKCIKNIEIILSALKQQFKITFSQVDIFVGINIMRDRENKSIFLHHAGYARKVLNRFNMPYARPVSTPMEKGIDLTVMQKDAQCTSELLPYHELVGSLIYLSTTTRSDLSFAYERFKPVYGQF